MKWYISVGDVHRWIEGVFYRHGLFCASHPFAIISLVITIVFVTCYPLLNLPLPGNAPQMYSTPVEGYTVPSAPSTEKPQQPPQHDTKVPRWFVGEPVGYIQQIVVKSAVSPWQTKRLIQTDAFRGPISTVFGLLEHINNFQIKKGGVEQSVGDLCLHVSESTVRGELARLLPQYNCLIVSPANFWQNDRTSFNSDGEIIKTMFKKLQPGIDVQPSAKDVLFGVAHKDTGVKKFFVRNRQRIVSYAVTIVLKKYDSQFVEALREKLWEIYPQGVNSSTWRPQLVHIHFKLHDYFVEYTPLIVTYAVLFMYIYFSVRKIEMVKSKWGLAFSAVVTVVCSLLMSVSVCLLFGLTPSLNGSEIFPYLVVIIGLENVLVVTKSVVSTPVHLDVKLRVAQGISKEGWYIFKNLVTELSILTIGFLTFVPAIQEFCLFAVVGLLTDFFLQMFFFTTVLSIDIRRMELSDLHKQSVQQSLQRPDGQYQHYAGTRLAPAPPPPPSSRATHTPRPVMALRIDTGEYLHELSPPPSPTAKPRHPQLAVARRVKLLHFWARTRVFQKIMMFCMVVWISLIVHKAGIVQYLTTDNVTVYDEAVVAMDTPGFDDVKAHDDGMQQPNNGRMKFPNDDMKLPNGGGKFPNDDVMLSKDKWKNQEKDHVTDPVLSDNSRAENGKLGDSEKEQFVQRDARGGESDASHDDRVTAALLQHDDPEQWRKLSYNHWPTLFAHYNISLEGKYVTVLPSIPLSVRVDMAAALAMRHPAEVMMVSRLSTYYNLAANYYGSETRHFGPNQSLTFSLVMKNLAVFPRTTVELLLHILLAIVTFIILVYFMVWLYKCMCPKDYGKWRAKWYRNPKRNSRRGLQYYKQIRESLPLLLEGHVQEIECIAVDGPLVVSACLGGYVKVWDSTSGECRTTILRNSGDACSADTDTRASAMERGDADAAALRRSHSSLAQDDAGALRRKRHPSKHTRYNSADLSAICFEDIAPDLSSKISTDFSTQERTRSQTLSLSNPSASNAPPASPASGAFASVASPFASVGSSNTSVDSSIAALTAVDSGLSTPPHQGWSSSLAPPQGPAYRNPPATSYTPSSAIYTPSGATRTASSAICTPSTASRSPHGSPCNTSAFAFPSSSPPISPDTGMNIASGQPQHPHYTSGPERDTCTSSPLHIGPVPAGGGGYPSAGATLMSQDDGSEPWRSGGAGGAGYDFGPYVSDDYEEHRQFVAEKKAYLEERQRRTQRQRDGQTWEEHYTSASLGESPGADSGLEVKDAVTQPHAQPASPVWCLQCQHDLVVAGCGDGSIEFWDGLTGELKLQYCRNDIGVTNICFTGKRLVAARLSGSIDFLELESGSGSDIPKIATSSKPSKAQKRGHRRVPSSHSVPQDLQFWDDELECRLLGSTRAHQRPITFLLCRGGQLLSASQDYTLKVFRLEDTQCVYTLYGHKGSITALCIDDTAPVCAVSGGEEGSVRLWDLSTGVCLHKLHGHTAPVTSVTGTRTHVVSTAADDRLCIWDRARGTLLHWIQLESGFCNSVCMLTSNLMVSGAQGCLYLWDVLKGEVLRVVELGSHDNCVYIRQLHVIDNCVVCDYGNQLRVIRFPSVLEKAD